MRRRADANRMLIDTLKAMVMLPLCLYLAMALGFALLRRKPRLARWLIGLGFGLLLLFSLPAVATLLQIGLQGPVPQAEVEAGDAQAIVVLGGDGNSFAPEFGGPSVGTLTLERLRYAARLAKRTQLPLLVSAGSPRRGEAPLSVAMASTLEGEFGVSVRWRESRSADTRENALFSAAILRAEGIERVLVVTHAWHEARALVEFERAGMKPRAAGTGWRKLRTGELGTWIPSARGLRESGWAMHEWFGRLWYLLT